MRVEVDRRIATVLGVVINAERVFWAAMPLVPAAPRVYVATALVLARFNFAARLVSETVLVFITFPSDRERHKRC